MKTELKRRVWNLFLAGLRNVALAAIFATIAVGLVAIIGPTITPTRIQAQGEVPRTLTPQAKIDENGGKAQWSVAENTYTSQFPDGFTFAVKASSSGGKIVSATAYWRHTPDHLNRVDVKVTGDGSSISLDWHPNFGNSVPQWVTVEYWWVLRDEAGNYYETEHQYDEYTDTTHTWKHDESDDVIVYWEQGVPDKVGQDVITAMARQKDFYKSNWGKILSYRPRVIIYATFDSFDEWDIGIEPRSPGVPGIVGLTSPEWGGTAQVYIRKYGTRGVAYGTVLHEVGHLYQFATGGTQGLPGWLVEGDASYFEMQPDYDYIQRVREMAADGTLPTLQGRGPAISGQNARDGYDIGYAFFMWLAETYGEDAHLKLWTLLAKGKSASDAIGEVTGGKFLDAEIAFRTWLGASTPIPPTLFPTRTPEPIEPADFPPTPTYEPTWTPHP